MKRTISVILAVIMLAGIFVFSGAATKAETVTLSGTNAGGLNNTVSVTASTDRWSAMRNSYLYKSSSGYTAVDWNGSEVVVTEYDTKFSKVSSKSIEPELPLFGGFYAASDYNYILFGNTNYAEDNDKEVMRLVRYDKDYNRVDSGSIKDCYTYEPFEAGSSSIAETNGYIMIHTARKRYASEDGVRHQSQLTVILDKESLSVRNDLGAFQPNHVSHSFNQYLTTDGKKIHPYRSRRRVSEKRFNH